MAEEETIKEKEEETEEAQEKKKAKKETKDIEAIINIYTSFNNTVVHVTDMSGRTLAKVAGILLLIM